MKKKIVNLPQERCDECAQTKMAFGFVSSGSGDGTPSKNLCPRCYNRRYTQRAGLVGGNLVHVVNLQMGSSLSVTT
jgi:hypothetical protein